MTAIVMITVVIIVPLPCAVEPCPPPGEDPCQILPPIPVLLHPGQMGSIPAAGVIPHPFPIALSGSAPLSPSICGSHP